VTHETKHFVDFSIGQVAVQLRKWLSNQIWDCPNFLRDIQIVIDADREMAIRTLRD
jgi:hypothetical protein